MMKPTSPRLDPRRLVDSSGKSKVPVTPIRNVVEPLLRPGIESKSITGVPPAPNAASAATLGALAESILLFMVLVSVGPKTSLTRLLISVSVRPRCTPCDTIDSIEPRGRPVDPGRTGIYVFLK